MRRKPCGLRPGPRRETAMPILVTPRETRGDEVVCEAEAMDAMTTVASSAAFSYGNQAAETEANADA